jgi:UDP-2,3-diacylglucosamine pyrophosphatase LpxH
MRTLLVSDLHLGSRLRRDVLRRPVAQAALYDAVASADRLVLLGDTVELTEARPREAMAVAEPVLREIGRRLGPGKEIVYVPGNHDRPLLRDWLRDHASELPPDGAVPPAASEGLERVVEMLAPARVQVRYPGAWLEDAIYATHGHYLDRHLLPVSPFGVFRRLTRHGEPAATVVDYEHGPHVTRLEALLISFLPRHVSALVDDLAGGLRGVAMAAIPHVTRLAVMRRLGPVGAGALSLQMRLAAIPALLHVMARMRIDARAVVFGHVHRCGPLERDHPGRWRSDGGPQVFNTGSWTWEPMLLYRARPPHPYWPGGAVVIEDGEPRAVGLLDAVSGRELHGPA